MPREYMTTSRHPVHASHGPRAPTASRGGTAAGREANQSTVMRWYVSAMWPILEIIVSADALKHRTGFRPLGRPVVRFSLVFFFDAVIAVASLWIAMLLRFEGNIEPAYWALLPTYTAVAGRVTVRSQPAAAAASLVLPAVGTSRRRARGGGGRGRHGHVHPGAFPLPRSQSASVGRGPRAVRHRGGHDRAAVRAAAGLDLPGAVRSSPQGQLAANADRRRRRGR